MFIEADKEGASLGLLSLSIIGDIPPLTDQPTLPNGIHLRWAFDRNAGFPWYGFYLFRRPTPLGGGSTVCLSSQLGSYAPGEQGRTFILPLGRFSSVDPITLTNDFAPSTVEVDLTRGESLPAFGVSFTLDPASPARLVVVTLGFVADFPAGGGNSGGGNNGSGNSGSGNNGNGTDGLGIGMRADSTGGCGCGGDHADLIPVAERVVAVAPGLYRAVFGYDNFAATPTTLQFGDDNRFFPEPLVRTQPTVFVGGRQRNVFSVLFDGSALTWRLAGRTVTVSAADVVSGTGVPGSSGGDDGSVGNQFPPPNSGGTGGGGNVTPPVDIPSGDPTSPVDGLVVVALRFGVPVYYSVVAGSAGQTVIVNLVADGIDEIRFSKGPARLIDLCVTRTTDGLGDGWVPVPDFPQPMLLPVRSPSYPLRSGTVNRSESEALALSRISYALPIPGTNTLDKSRWQGQTFADIHDELLAIVDGGPSKGITDHVETVTALPDPTDPTKSLPQSIDQSSLDLLLGATINPAAAQMLGLYFIDASVTRGQSYDYLLVADHHNAASGNLATVQTLIAAANYASLDGYLHSGVVFGVTPALAAPASAQCYALPVGSPPPGLAGDVAGVAGLNWELGLQNGKLSPTSPVLYNVWRAGLGHGDVPFQAVPGASHVRVNAAPVAAALGELPRFPVLPPAPDGTELEPPPRAVTGWPAFPLLANDGPLPDGWYAYRISGIDLFGRYSGLSEPAQWLAIDGQSVLNAYAVLLEDRTPPPPPIHVQAWLLDPKDPFLLRDGPYQAWAATKPNTQGLRVRWEWSGKQQRSAPDLREFRIYFNPSNQLTNPTDPEVWAQRIAVSDTASNIVSRDLTVAVSGVGATVSGSVITLPAGTVLDQVSLFGSEVQLGSAPDSPAFFIREIDALGATITVDGSPSGAGPYDWTIGLRETIYELFLPNASQGLPISFEPTIHEPVRYALVGVSAADDKPVADKRDGTLGDRDGNESGVGGPATVYRVLRDLPGPAPLIPFSDDRLLATRADFYSRSYFTLHWSNPKNSGLSTHVFRCMDATLFQIDAIKGFSGTPRAAELAQANVLPQEWDTARRQAAIAQINALTKLDDYDTLSNDALRALASLPSNAEGFTRLTRAPLSPDDTANDDHVGRNDDPASYQAQADRSAFDDTLDGRARNRYFYRATSVDAAQNSGPLGVSTPPVYLPETRIPPTIAITSCAGQEQAIALSWSDRPDLGIDHYLVYRADSAAAAADLSQMTVLPLAPMAGSGSEGRVQFVDAPVLAFKDFYYRLVSVGGTGVRSAPSDSVRARAFQRTAVSPPTLTSVERLPAPQVGFRLSFGADADVSSLVQRRVEGASAWVTLGSWLPVGTHQFDDTGVVPGAIYEYRLRGRNAAKIQTPLSNILDTEAL